MPPENLDAPHVPESLLLPSQWQDWRRANYDSGSKRLMKAVLEEAFHMLMSYHGNPHTRARRLFEETYEWFMADNPSWLYSFVSVCGHLGIDVDWFRNGLKRWLVNHRERGGQLAVDAAYSKPLSWQPKGGGRPPAQIWAQKMRNLMQWRVFYRKEGQVYVLGSYGSAADAHQAVRRAKRHPWAALHRALRRKEAEVAAV